MSKDIYVAFERGDKEIGWMVNPGPTYVGDVYLSFTSQGPTAGVSIDSVHAGLGSGQLVGLVHDALERLGIQWFGLRGGTFHVVPVNKKPREMFFMNFSLAGPLPLEVAEQFNAKIVDKPVRIMHRYGG